MRKIWFFFLLFSVSFLTAATELSPFEGSKTMLLSKKMGRTLDLAAIFYESPFIYSILIGLSIIALLMWLYTILTLRVQELMPKIFLHEVKEKCKQEQFIALKNMCKEENHLLARLVLKGIEVQKKGYESVKQSMENEGRRYSNVLWQRVDILQDISTTAPMFGLLGTVLGLFYAFYDTSRSVESLMAIFDGLGIAMGTTVAGLIVSLLATSFYTLLRHRLIHVFSCVEEQAESIAFLIQPNVKKNSPPKKVKIPRETAT